MTAENYHLKWDSHLSYLNSSIATLYKNEKFADVMLYSSSSVSHSCNGSGTEEGIPTVGISAHKFILSSCSQFFATMFETSPVASPLGVLYVVLPPELSHRAIQILVQYMYSGEATVSNDILSEVLRGGELLKIRGLCRTTMSSHTHMQSINSNLPHYGPLSGRNIISQAGCPNSQPASSAHSNEMYGGKCSSSSSRYSSVEQQLPHHHQFRGLGASVMPKESPVIVKSPKLQQIPLLQPGTTTKHSNGVVGAVGGGAGGGVGISINKDVAIDPEDKSTYSIAQEPLPGNMTSSVCPGMGCRSCSISAVMENEQLRRRQDSVNDDHMAPQHVIAEQIERSRTHYQETRRMSVHCNQMEEEDTAEDHVVEYDHHLRRQSTTDHGGNFYVPESFEHSTTTSSKNFSEPTTANRLVDSSARGQKFLHIKQEPADWPTTLVTNSNASSRPETSPPSEMLSPKEPLDFKMPLDAVKLETNSAHSGDEEEMTAALPPTDYNSFTRLSCEVCKKSFDDPKTWVRHLETHASTTHDQQQTETSSANCGEATTKTHVPKKRRRVSQQENTMDHVTLLCDICATSFETPAEWVRHMNNQHTDIELAMFNSKRDNEQQSQQTKLQSDSSGPSTAANQHKKATSSRATLSYVEYAEKICNICNKKFSSNTNMLLHKRSHSTTDNANSSVLSTFSNVPIVPQSEQQQQHQPQQSNGGLPNNNENNAAGPTA